jgi:hypothetical protein
MPFVRLEIASAGTPPLRLPCLPLRKLSKSPPPGHAFVVLTLPKAIDPRGCAIRVERGSLIFKTYPETVEYTATGLDGRPNEQWDSQLPGAVESYVRTSSALKIRTSDGSTLVFPANATIKPPDANNVTIIVVRRDERIPKDGRGRPLKPDFVVP